MGIDFKICRSLETIDFAVDLWSFSSDFRSPLPLFCVWSCPGVHFVSVVYSCKNTIFCSFQSPLAWLNSRGSKLKTAARESLVGIWLAVRAFQPNWICRSRSRGFHRAGGRQEAGISPWSVLWIRTGCWQTAKQSSRHCVLHVCVSGWICERACVFLFFFLGHVCALQILAGWALSQDSPRTQSSEQGAGCQLNAQMFPQKDSTDTVFLCFVSLMSRFFFLYLHKSCLWNITIIWGLCQFKPNIQRGVRHVTEITYSTVLNVLQQFTLRSCLDPFVSLYTLSYFLVQCDWAVTFPAGE